MSVNIGSSTGTNGVATAYSSGRHIVKSSNGTLVLFAYISDSTIAYKVSTDDGVTWDGSWTNIETGSAVAGQIDTYIDTNDDIYLIYYAYYSSSNRVAFRKLTYSSGTWSIGSRISVASTISGCRPTITKKSNGDLWVGFTDNNDRFYGFYSTDGGTNWNSTSVTSLTSAYISVIYPYSSNIREVVQINGKLSVYEYTTSWGSGSDIVASGITNDNQGLGFLRISDSEIYVAARTTSGIKVFKWNGSSWDAGTLLSNHANDTHPHIINVNAKPVVIWKDYNGTNYNIYYRYWNGSSWNAEVTITSDAAIDAYPSGVTYDLTNLYIAWTTGSGSPYTIYFDKITLNPTKQVTILSDSTIKILGQQVSILSDAVIGSPQVSILSDAKIQILGQQQSILSDAEISIQNQTTILSDAKILIAGQQQTILSDAKICIEVLFDINNKVNFTKQILSNINNVFNSVIEVITDINNLINTCKLVIADITNDFRTQKLTLNNISNDIRFLYSWQKAVDGTIQSLGKEYIKVYIGGIEQTNIDIDSINISKDLNTSHTAVFELASVYDATKPAMESTVQIKYNNWILFSGYITQIVPSESPEKIRINCQDEYWKQNKSNVYYNVGHKPKDNKELYYETILSALTTQHSWAPGIGNFVPQTIDNFATGKSDAITRLIQESGNYSWFYEVDGTKKLWTAGNGSVINIKRQTLGSNIGLYDLINHSFTDDIENIVNKLRVQMGDKIIQKDNNSRNYTGYNFSSYHDFVHPAWDVSLELLSNQTSSGYGFDHQNPALSAEYQLVFTKYNMPYLNPDLSSWSDTHPPSVEIYGLGYTFGFIGPLNLQLEKVLKEGFTIDYEKKTITFNEPYFLYQQDNSGQCIAVRAPIVAVFLWKKNYYTYTTDPSDNPETDISNPLMFITAKMGSYTDTIIKDLNLSNLSIQVGYIQHDYLTGEDIIIPSWDDTNFAKDLADWNLSKTCDKQIKGTIELTLDAVCFYGMDLTKRIYIAGITDTPMNITAITYNISSFTVSLQLENSRYYNRSTSIQSRGE